MSLNLVAYITLASKWFSKLAALFLSMKSSYAIFDAGMPPMNIPANKPKAPADMALSSSGLTPLNSLLHDPNYPTRTNENILR